jgi:carboxymethylenebutenolidase
MVSPVKHFRFLFLVLLVSSMARAAMLPITCNTTYRQEQIRISGQPVELEVFAPPEQKRYAAVLMIHGSAGLFSHPQGQPSARDNFGEHTLACNGFVAILVHYFDVSGVKSTTDVHFIQANAPVWLDELHSVLDWITTLPNVDDRHISVLGESLGGYLAIALGLTDKRIRLVSAFSSGSPRLIVSRIINRPLTLLYHGARDSLIPVEQSLQTQRWLRTNKIRCRLRIFENLDHGLNEAAATAIISELIALAH